MRGDSETNHVVIPCGAIFHQIRDGDAIQIFVDDLVQALPHRQRTALAHSGAGFRPLSQAGHRGQRFLRQAQNAAHGVLLRGLSQAVAAALAPQAFQNLALDQDPDDAFQILFRNLLPLGNAAQRNKFLRLMLRQVDHHPQGIASFC